MTDYPKIKQYCQYQSELSRQAIDNFLIYYAAAKNNLDKEFDAKLSRYKGAAKKLPATWAGFAKSQYIGHRIFCEDGLIHKYLKHSAVKDLPAEQLNFLQEQSAWPWKFRFCTILSQPAADFFLMMDIYREEEFLLYSPSITKTLSEQEISLCFVLTGYNGQCWQSFGPFVPFAGFDADDIFFYATELSEDIYNEESLLEIVEENPVPFMLLIAGSGHPRIYTRDFETVQVVSSDAIGMMDTAHLRSIFRVEYSPPVFKFTLPDFDTPPHFASAYYDEEKGIFQVTALTEYGYEKIRKELANCGIEISKEPEIRVHLQMLEVIRTVLGRKIELNSYDHLFTVKPSAVEEKFLDSMNRFLQLALPFINAGKEPDIEALAKQAGVDPEAAKEILSSALERVKYMKNKGNS